MKKETVMKTRDAALCHRVTLCLCIAAACLMAARPAPAQVGARLEYNYAPPTAAQLALMAEITRLDLAASAALHTGDYATAETDARASIALGPDAGTALEVLAPALDAQGKASEAFQAYQALYNRGGNAPRNYLPYALKLLNAGQWAQAISVYAQALPQVPEQNSPVNPKIDVTFSADDPQPSALAAAIHVALGLTENWTPDVAGYDQHDKALIEYQKALQLTPDWAVANYYYGYGLRKLRRNADARAAFQKAAALDAGGNVKTDAEKALSGR